jgi:hypothetical protein
MKNLLDFDFINFYVDKKYGKTLSDYFSVSKSIVSKWRYELPEKRLHEFVYREGTEDIIELIKRIY